MWIYSTLLLICTELMAFREKCISSFGRILVAIRKSISIFVLNTAVKLDFLITQEILASRYFYTWKFKLHIRGKTQVFYINKIQRDATV